MTDALALTPSSLTTGMKKRLAQLDRAIAALEPAVLLDTMTLAKQINALSKRRETLRAMTEEQALLSGW